MTLPNLLHWAQLKGLDILSTGDCLHGPWLRDLETHLTPGPDGFLHPSDDLVFAGRQNLPTHLHRPIRFVLGTEVSCEARSTDDQRGIHCLAYFPDFPAVHAARRALAPFADLDGEKQGRPALILPARDVLQHILAVGGHFAPAHIWNSFVSLLNAQDGYARVSDCFSDLTPELLGLEAALTSTPAHCRRLSQLDRHALLANSDAHSLPKLGRECTLFEIPGENASDFTYDTLFSAIRRRPGTPARFLGTEEYPVVFTRYWLNWCSHCQKSYDAPAQAPCPVCRKRLVVGARDRLAQLADRPAPAKHLPFVERLPLIPLLTALARRSEPNDDILRLYHALITALGPERTLLNTCSADDIARHSFPALALAILAQRSGQLDFAALLQSTAATSKNVSPPSPRQQLDLFS